ncbi:MAG: tRNA lysidine(34) synthetase TilS [Simkania sp.]|nr:tRNA lysidine(34) synthetase TilS [Simkania sp.]
MSKVLQHLDKFFDEHHDAGAPVLLGFSGGPDSAAMFHALYRLQRKHAMHLIVIHVDHGWRKESTEEAGVCKQRIEQLGIQCIVVRPPQEESLSNREERARDSRIAIFRTLYQLHKAQALILAHQAGDQAETVLKRIFEGGHMSTVKGMRPVSTLEDMIVWRPFLAIPKRELVQFCHEKGIAFLHDYTNEDKRYLRARMRKEILPLLEESFGKAIEENLCRLADSFQEMTDYMEMQTQTAIAAAERSKEWISIDLSGRHPFEAQSIIRQLAVNEGVSLGQQHIRHLVQLLEDKRSKRTFSIKGGSFLVHRGRLTLFVPFNVINESNNSL